MQTYVNRRWDIEDSRRALPRCDVLQATCATYFLVLMGSAATIFSPHHGASGRKTDVFSAFKRKPSSTSNVNNMFGVCLISTRQFWSVIRRRSWHVIFFLPPAVRFSVPAHARKLSGKAFRSKTSFSVILFFSNLWFFQLHNTTRNLLLYDFLSNAPNANELRALGQILPFVTIFTSEDLSDAFQQSTGLQNNSGTSEVEKQGMVAYPKEQWRISSSSHGF